MNGWVTFKLANSNRMISIRVELIVYLTHDDGLTTVHFERNLEYIDDFNNHVKSEESLETLQKKIAYASKDI